MGTMVDIFKHEGTTDRERERLKMSVKTPTSWNVHALSTRPGMRTHSFADVHQFEGSDILKDLKDKYNLKDKNLNDIQIYIYTFLYILFFWNLYPFAYFI